jgi:diguanylate cyclase (GGDEF)-like protein
LSLLSKIIQALSRLLFPGGLVLGIAAILPMLGLSQDSASSPLPYLPQGIFLAGLVLSGVFRRGRVFFALLILSMTHAALGWLVPRVSPVTGSHLTTAIALLLPLNFAALALAKERGIISPAGRLRLVVLALQAIAVGLLGLPQFGFLMNSLDRSFLPTRFSSWSHLPQPVLAAFALATITLMGYLLLRYRSVESGLLWALAAAFLAFRFGGIGFQASTLWSASGAILLVALLETSYKMAYHDELTQLPSRRALNEALMKLPDWYTVAMVDVDHFKKFNDTYGHAAGDHALRLVASRLARVAGGGKAYRYGGEEFAVLFAGRPNEDVFVYLDRLRRVIEQTTFVVRGKDRRKSKRGKVSRGRSVKTETNVTVSIGVASSDGDRLATTEVMKAADQALYRAKAKGRNCTVCATLRKGPSSVQTSMRTIGAS